MSQDVKISSKVCLNISLNTIYTVNQSELTSQQYYVMELQMQVLQNKKQSMFFSLTRIVCNQRQNFLNALGLDSSQDATKIFDAMIAAFQKHNLSSLLQKIIFLPSDGASVNSGHNSGLILCFHKDREWVTFIWYFSNHLELALKDGFKMYTSPVDEPLIHLFYLYKNSSKKHKELKNLYQ